LFPRARTCAGIRLSSRTQALTWTSAGWGAATQARAARELEAAVMANPFGALTACAVVTANAAWPVLLHCAQPAGSAPAAVPSKASLTPDEEPGCAVTVALPPSGVPPSATVSDWLPAVLNVTFHECTPASPAVKVYAGGREASASLLVNVTVPR